MPKRKTTGKKGSLRKADKARDAVDFQALFEQSPDILLVLRPDAPKFTMVAATRSRFAATATAADSLGTGLFEVFPDNPDDAEATGTSNPSAPRSSA